MTESDYTSTIKAFIASKVESGHPDLFLFKNRSGQWVYQIYDAASGKPKTPEMFYLVYGKPNPDASPWKMPLSKGEVKTQDGLSIVGLEYNPDASEQSLTDELNSALNALIAA